MKRFLLTSITLLVALFTNAQCNEPGNIRIEYLDLDFATITWEANDATHWDLELGEFGFTPSGIPNVENHTTNHYYLEDFSYHHFDLYIRAYCGETYSDWVGPVELYSYCIIMNETATELDFGFGEEFPPECWTLANEGTPESSVSGFENGRWEQGIFANSGENTCAKISFTDAVEYQEWLISPILFFELTLCGFLDSIDVEFNIALTDSGTTNPSNLEEGEVIQMLYWSDYTNSWIVVHTWNEESVISNIGESFSIEISNEIEGVQLGTANQIAFLASRDADTNLSNTDFFIDNILITPNIVSLEEFDEYDCRLYPNPASNNINVSADTTIDSVKIYNQLGQLVKSLNVNNLQTQIDISDLENSLYSVIIQIEDTQRSSILIIQK